MEKLADLTRKYEKIYPSILNKEFDEDMDYFQTEAHFQKLQEKIIESYLSLKKSEMSLDLQKGYRILLQMIDNARNLIQSQMNIRTGKAFYIHNKVNVDDFLSKNIEKDAWQKMDVGNALELDVSKRLAFFVLTNAMMLFRDFFIELVEKMLNKLITKEMAENLVDKVVISPIFEDAAARKHDSLQKFVESLPESAKGRLVTIHPSISEDLSDQESDQEEKNDV
jgi:hypothetical protein